MPRYNVAALIVIDAPTQEDAEEIARRVVKPGTHEAGMVVWSIEDVQEIDPEDIPNA